AAAASDWWPEAWPRAAAAAPRQYPHRRTMPRQRAKKTSAGKAPRVERTSEPRTKTDVEQLRLVERLLLDRNGKIKPDRADRRFPGDTDTGARADRGRVGDDRLHAAGRDELGRRQDEVLLIVRP